MKTDEYYIERCFQLALNGMGNVAPNPLVGCVIVKDGLIIGEGYHQQYGQGHAEVNAIRHVADKTLLEGATAYVSLEPCSHYGNTPPCCNLLIEKKVKRVVFSNLDPNPLVAGQGIQKLREAGIEVSHGILKEKGYELNKRFFTFMIQKRPYIILKWAQTLDGFMDVDRSCSAVQDYWISNKELKVLVHKWRSQESAIMVGKHTLQNDNPQLNTRLWKGKNPIRITLDKNYTLPKNLHFFDQQQASIVYTQQHNIENSLLNVEAITIPFKEPINEICQNLFERKIQSVIVEGGKTLLENFLRENKWDEVRLLIGNKTFSKGLLAPQFPCLPKETHTIGDNQLLIFKNDTLC